jgi:hypothetical protein
MATLAHELVGIACLPHNPWKSNSGPCHYETAHGVEHCLKMNGCIIVDRNKLGQKRRLRYQVMDANQNVLHLSGHINKAWSFACAYKVQ